MITLYEVRVFARDHDNVSFYDVSIISTRGTKRTKKTQFCSTLKLQNRKIVVDKNKRKGCFYPNAIWNDDNYIKLSKAVLAWFVDNVKVRKAFSTEDDTAFWHFKKTNQFGDRYTLYECSLEFLTRKLNHWSTILRE